MDAENVLWPYIEAIQKAQPTRLSLDQKRVHDAIQNHKNLSDQAQLIIMVTTFVPSGRYITYKAIASWVWSVRTALCVPVCHVASALKKAASYFNLDEVPIHRVVERNGVWGTHMLSADDEERARLLEEEGYCIGPDDRISGSALEVYEFLADMKNTAVKRYVINMPDRFAE